MTDDEKREIFTQMTEEERKAAITTGEALANRLAAEFGTEYDFFQLNVPGFCEFVHRATHLGLSQDQIKRLSSVLVDFMFSLRSEPH